MRSGEGEAGSCASCGVGARCGVEGKGRGAEAVAAAEARSVRVCFRLSGWRATAVGVGGRRRGVGPRGLLRAITSGEGWDAGSEDAVVKEDAVEARGEGQRAPMRSSSDQVWKR